MKYLLLIFFGLTILACSEGHDETLLLGAWDTTEWTVVDSGKKINNKMDFEFKAERRYEIDYGTEKEVGKYWIANDYLHTVEDGATEKKVLIEILSPDSLQFKMNRAGSMERVILVKSK